MKRPRSESGGKTPAIGDHQARDLLTAPAEDTIKDKRDRAILSTLLYHALRREELCKLKVKDFKHARRGVPHLKVSGKGDKTRYLPLHPGTNALDHQAESTAVWFRASGRRSTRRCGSGTGPTRRGTDGLHDSPLEGRVTSELVSELKFLSSLKNQVFRGFGMIPAS